MGVPVTSCSARPGRIEHRTRPGGRTTSSGQILVGVFDRDTERYVLAPLRQQLEQGGDRRVRHSRAAWYREISHVAYACGSDPATGNWTVIATSDARRLELRADGRARRGRSWSAPAPVAAKYEIDRLESLGDATFAAITIDRRAPARRRRWCPAVRGRRWSATSASSAGIAVDPTGGVHRVMVVGSDLMAGAKVGRCRAWSTVIAPGIVPLVPGRLLDTRANGETVDGLFEKGGRPDAASVTSVQIAGRGGVPDDAGRGDPEPHLGSARASAGSSPCIRATRSGRRRRTSTTSPVRTPRTVWSPSSTLTDRCACTRDDPPTCSSTSTDSYRSRGSVEPVVPARYLDTRQGDDFETFDGQSLGAGRVGAESVTRVRVAGRGVVPQSATARPDQCHRCWRHRQQLPHRLLVRR